MIPTAEITRRLNERAESLCQMLLPGGRMVKNEYVTGGLDGGEGKSLKVSLTGSHIGKWRDWATDEHGDMLDLWRMTRNLSPGDAMRAAKEYLGIQDNVRPAVERTYAPAPKRDHAPPQEGSRSMQWLREVRKLTQATLEVFRVRTQPAFGPRPASLVFESWSPKGELVNRSYRSIPTKPDEKKQVWQDTGCAPALFGWQALTEAALKSKSILLAEGQIDAMTWHQWGIPALSIPNGSGMTWLEYEWENLEFFERIYLAFDGDATGSDIRAKTIARLGNERCYLVTLPHKDANDCLQAGCTAEEAKGWIEAAKAPRVDGLITAAELRERLVEELRPKPIPFTAKFMDLDWSEQQGLYFREGEVTLWTGTSHSGKSTMLNFLNNLYLAAKPNEGLFVGSFEVKPETTLRRMVTACVACIGAMMCQESADSYLSEYGDRLVFADVVGFIEEETLFQMMRFAFRRYGVTSFVIDSLMKVKGLDDDYPRQNDFINRLQEFAKPTGVHIHLVAHPRKGQGGGKPGLMDVKGSSVLSNAVDNVVVVCRNHEKAEAMREGELTYEQKQEYDTEIRVEKQKESGWLGAFFLRFDPRTYTYSRADKPKRDEKPAKKYGRGF